MSLIAQYLFQNNGQDEMGNYNATSTTDVTYENIPNGYRFSGKVAVFNGTSSKIDLPNITPISGTSARSIEFWSYVERLEFQEIFTCGTSNTNSSFIFQAPSMHSLIPGQYAITTMGVAAGYGACEINSWNHCVITLPSNGTLADSIVYINGQARETNVTEGTPATINVGDQYYSIGYRSRNSSNYFNGKLANVRIYNEVLTSEEIQKHFFSEWGGS